MIQQLQQAKQYEKSIRKMKLKAQFLIASFVLIVTFQLLRITRIRDIFLRQTSNDNPFVDKTLFRPPRLNDSPRHLLDLARLWMKILVVMTTRWEERARFKKFRLYEWINPCARYTHTHTQIHIHVSNDVRTSRVARVERRSPRERELLLSLKGDWTSCNDRRGRSKFTRTYALSLSLSSSYQSQSCFLRWKG